MMYLKTEHYSTQRQWLLSSLVIAGLIVAVVPAALAEYPRAGWSAELATYFHDVSGTVTIIDDRTLLVEHFTFDGGGPAVYFYLGATDSNVDFENGLQLDPKLDRAYNDESLTLTLPPGETLDGYGAISVWCALVSANFGSGPFVSPGLPYDRRGWIADIPLGEHDAEGLVTIINHRILFVEHFYYDGRGPLVYFTLGAMDKRSAYIDGLWLMPELVRAYSDESLVLTLPDGQTMDDWGAISVWCAEFNANFSSAPFDGLYSGDLNCDGSLNSLDTDPFVLALTNPATYDITYPDCEITLADINDDGSINSLDIDPFVTILTGG